MKLEKVSQTLMIHAVVELPVGEPPPLQSRIYIDPRGCKWITWGTAMPLDAGLLSNPPSPVQRWRIELRAADKTAIMPEDGLEFTPR